MKNLCIWHEKLTEKKRMQWKVTHYQVYWISWFKGIIFGILIGFLFSCENANKSAEWTYLFDGETTNGWRAYNGDNIPKQGAAINGN